MAMKSFFTLHQVADTMRFKRLKILQGIILLEIDLVPYGCIILDLYLEFCLLVWQLVLLF